MNHEEMLDAAESVLKTAGFKISRQCNSRLSCFGIVARKESDLTFIKVLSDIGKISLRDALELQTISSRLSAMPLLIGDKSREKPLEDDTVYTRYSIYAVTVKTLEDVVSKRMFPLVEAGPGGYYVRLNGELIRNRRMKLGLSIGKLAEEMRVSRRTLYGYERGMAKASVSAAFNLEWILGIPLVEPIDILKPVPSEAGFFGKAKRLIVRNRFLQIVLRRLVHCNFNVSATTRAPFDFIARSPNADVNILGGVTRHGERNIDQRAQEIVSISDVVNAQPLFITDGKLVPIGEIPTIHSQEFEKIQLAEDLISKL
jgi:putative transcriptional regulator